MQYACATVADVVVKLKHQYQKLVGAPSSYGHDKPMAKQIDALGLLIKELEDAVVVLQIKLDLSREDVQTSSSDSAHK
jgi:hypothetical protein